MQVGDSLGCFVLVSHVTAQQVGAKRQSVFHDLVADALNGLHVDERRRNRGARTVLSLHAEYVDQKQEQHDREDRSKPEIQLLTDRH